jgi:hypothetical protein
MSERQKGVPNSAGKFAGNEYPKRSHVSYTLNTTSPPFLVPANTRG